VKDDGFRQAIGDGQVHVCNFLDKGSHPVDGQLDDLGQQCLLGREVVIQARLRDSNGTCELGHGSAIEPVLREERCGLEPDAFPRIAVIGHDRAPPTSCIPAARASRFMFLC